MHRVVPRRRARGEREDRRDVGWCGKPVDVLDSRPRDAPADRRGLHRSPLVGIARGPIDARHDRHPIREFADATETGRDHHRHHPDATVACRPRRARLARWQGSQAIPTRRVVHHPGPRSRGARHTRVLVVGGGQHLRRRLQLHRRTHHRRCGLRRQLLPLFRCATRPLRLALPGDRRDDARQSRHIVDATARLPARTSRLVADLPRGDPAPGTSGAHQHSGCVVGGIRLSRTLVALQQRSAARTGRSGRRTPHVVLRRTCHRHTQIAAVCGRRRRCGVHPCAGSRWSHGRGRAARGCPSHRAHHRVATSARRTTPDARADFRGRNPCAVRDLRRPATGPADRGQQGGHRRRPDPRVVAGADPLLLPHPAHRRRYARTSLRRADHDPVPRRRAPATAAQTASQRRCARTDLAADRGHARHDVLHRVHTDQVDSSLRRLCRNRRRTRGRRGRDDGADHSTIAPQPRILRGSGSRGHRNLVRGHQRLVVRRQLWHPVVGQAAVGRRREPVVDLPDRRGAHCGGRSVVPPSRRLHRRTDANRTLRALVQQAEVLSAAGHFDLHGPVHGCIVRESRLRATGFMVVAELQHTRPHRQ